MYVADEAAIILGPLLGRGGGPILDAAVCAAAFDGGRPCPRLPLTCDDFRSPWRTQKWILRQFRQKN